MTTLAEDMQQRIHTLESLLQCERKNCTKLHQKLSSANEELLQLRKEKEVSNQNCSEALNKVRVQNLASTIRREDEENGDGADFDDDFYI